MKPRLLFITIFTMASGFAFGQTIQQCKLDLSGYPVQKMFQQTVAPHNGKYLRANGEFKTLVVFISYQSDPTNVPDWPQGQDPENLNTILSSSPTNIPSHKESLSHFFNVNSGSEYKQNGGEFKVYGNAVHVTLPYSSTAHSYQTDIRNGLIQADNLVDYSDYDTRDNSIGDLSNGSDGIVDKIIVVLRGKYLGGAQGWNVLDYSGSTLNLDGVTLSDSGAGGSGVSVAWPDNFDKNQLLGIIVHEIGHHILSRTHPHANGYVSDNYKKWSLLYQSLEKKDGFSVNAFESWILGWSNPTILSSDYQIDLDDFLTTGESVLYKLPGKDYEFYGIENRQKLNVYDDATVNSNDKGIFITHYNIEDYFFGSPSYSPSIRVYTSDGRYDWDYYQDVPSHWNPNQYIPAFEKAAPEPISGGDVFSMHYKPSDASWNHLYAIKPLGEPVEGSDFFKGGDVFVSYNDNSKPLFASITNPAPSDWSGSPTDFAVRINDQNGSTVDIDVFTNYDPYTITENTKWDGQIFLEEDTEVDNNSTLTILPGTTVYLSENVILRIEPGSKIIAEGTQSEPIRFIRADPAGKWNKIHLRSSAGNSFEWVVFDGGDRNVEIASKNNTFKHITSRNGWRGISGWHNADGTGNSEAEISYALIEDNTSVGVVSHYMDLDMSYTTIRNNAQAGLYISSNTVYPFHHNVISGNGGTSRDGIEIPSSSGALYMQGSGYSEGYNQVHDNGDDQISNSGDLIAGNVYPLTGGYNSLEGSYGGSNYFVDNNTGTTVYAEYVWWDQYPAHPDMTDGPVQFDQHMQTSDPTLGQNPGEGGQTPSKQRNDDRPLPQQITETYYEASQTLGSAKTNQQVRDEIYRLYQLAGLADDEQVKRDFIQRIKDIAEAKTRVYSTDHQHAVLQNYAQVLYSKSLLREEQYEQATTYLSEWDGNNLTGHDRKDYLSLKATVETYHGAYESALGSLEELYAFQSTFEQEKLEEVKAQYAPLEEDIRRRMTEEGSSGATDDREKIHTENTNELTAQNYPNPFNPTTKIRFSLPERSKVRLVVYDMLGREVATLVNGVLSAGQQTVSFDASNLSNGMYLYKLRAGGQEIVNKMTLIK